MDDYQFAKFNHRVSSEVYIFHCQSLKFKIVNLEGRKNLGYTNEELLNLTPLDIKPEFSEASFREYTRPLLTGEVQSLSFKTLHKRKNKTTYPANIFLKISTKSSNTFFVAEVTDLSDKGISDDPQYSDKAQLAIYQSMISLGKWTLNLTTNTVTLSPEAAAILGTSTEALSIPLSHFIHGVHPDDQDALLETYKRLDATKTQAITEFRLQDKQGIIKWIKQSYGGFTNTNKQACIAGYIQDITSEKEVDVISKNLSLQAIRTLSLAAEARDPYTVSHQKHVSEIAVRIAQELDLPAHMIEGIQLGALIHDIGKIGTPLDLLFKPTKLTIEEYSLIQVHAETGYHILKDFKAPWPITEIVHQHHERLDGSGYPLGLKGDEICFEAHVVILADVIEAISAHRPYRIAPGLEIAIAEIQKNKGILYHPDVVDACMRLYHQENLI